MAQYIISDEERKAFIIACKNNGVSISKTPQKIVSSAAIYSRGKRVIVTNDLIIKKGKRVSTVSPRTKRVPKTNPTN